MTKKLFFLTIIFVSITSSFSDEGIKQVSPHAGSKAAENVDVNKEYKGVGTAQANQGHNSEDVAVKPPDIVDVDRASDTISPDKNGDEIVNKGLADQHLATESVSCTQSVSESSVTEQQQTVQQHQVPDSSSTASLEADVLPSAPQVTVPLTDHTSQQAQTQSTNHEAVSQSTNQQATSQSTNQQAQPQSANQEAVSQSSNQQAQSQSAQSQSAESQSTQSERIVESSQSKTVVVDKSSLPEHASSLSEDGIQGSFSQSDSVSVDPTQATASLVQSQLSHTVSQVQEDLPLSGEMLPSTDSRVGRVEQPTATVQVVQQDTSTVETVQSDTASVQTVHLDTSTVQMVQADTATVSAVESGKSPVPALQPDATGQSAEATQAMETLARTEEPTVETPKEKDLPTFEEWSEKYMAEQEKQKADTEEPPSVVKTSQKKLRQNFAAGGCGAKVVSSNSEAEHTSFLLNGNPDEYMISPCKAKKWFVVELCEPLQIHKVELGSVELFSSQPKSFRLFSSHKFPTKEWIPLGTYELTAERTVQSFPTTIAEEFVKFVKVEMFEHHGDEHYCPITTFRVLGLDMASDDEDTDSEQAEIDGQAEGSSPETDEITESKNLFASAKDNVVKLIQKVLYKPEEEEGQGPGPKDNMTQQEEEEPLADKVAELKDPQGVTSIVLPDSDSVTKSQVNIDQSQALLQDNKLGDNKSGEKKVDKLEEKVEEKEIPIVKKLDATEQLPSDSLANVVVEKSDKRRSLCQWHPLETYLQLMNIETSTVYSPCRIPKSQAVSKSEMSTAEIEHIRPRQEEVGTSTVREEASLVSDQSSSPTSPSGEVPKPSSVSTLASPSPRADDITAPLADPKVDSHTKEELSTSQSTTFAFADVSATKSEILEPSSLSSHANLEVKASVLTPGLGGIQYSHVVQQEATDITDSLFLKVTPSPTKLSEDSQDEVVNLLVPETPSSSEMPVKGETGEPLVKLDEKPDEGKVNTTQGISPSSQPTVATKKGVELVKVAMTSNSKRDMSIMKLSNRIVALEANVSMTKRYLEELSRAFKLQNEDMMKLLNNTVSRLNSHIIQSEEKDEHHKALIAGLEEKVRHLSEAVDSLQSQVILMGRELNQRQWLLSVFQILLFLWMFISSCRRPPPAPGNSQCVIMGNSSLTLHETKVDQSEASDVCSKVAVVGMKRELSQSNLDTAADTPAGDITANIANSGPGQGTKKKKKKKLKAALSLDTHSDIPSSIPQHSGIPNPLHSGIPTATPLQSDIPAPNPLQNFSQSAGVLFGASSELDPSLGSPQDGGLHIDNCADRKTVGCDLVPVSGQGDSGQRENDSDNGYSSQPANQVCPLTGGTEREKERETDRGVERGMEREIFEKFVNDVAEKIHQRVFVNDSLRLELISKDKRSDCSGNQLSVDPLGDSPEFKLPAYHKGKPRAKLCQTKSGDSWFSKPQVCDIQPASAHGQIQPRSAHSHGSEWPTGFFLSNNYLSENRFKFPVSGSREGSPPDTPSTTPGTPTTTTDLPTTSCLCQSSQRRVSTSSHSSSSSRFSQGNDEISAPAPSGVSAPAPAGVSTKKEIPPAGPSFIAFSPQSTTDNTAPKPPPQTASHLIGNHKQSTSCPEKSDTAPLTSAPVTSVPPAQTSLVPRENPTHGRRKNRHKRPGSPEPLTKSGSCEKPDNGKTSGQEVKKSGQIKQHSAEPVMKSVLKSRKSVEFSKVKRSNPPR